MMMRSGLLAASVLALASCSSAAEPGRVPAPSASVDGPVVGGTPAAAPVFLPKGEFRLAGVDGNDVSLPHAITASIGNDSIEIVSGCIRFAWSHRLDGERLVTERMPAAACRRSLLPEESAIATIFGRLETVQRTPGNGYRLSGGGHSLTLHSQ